MKSMLLYLLKSVVSILKIPLFIIISFMIVFASLVAIRILYMLIKGYRFKKGTYKKVSRPNIFKRLLVDFPKRYADDIMERDPDAFQYKGIIIYTGEQGNGKTISIMEEVNRIQREYPKCKCITNIKYEKQDDKLKHWKQLTDYKNGKYGVIVVIDELQNWFSSKQSKNFPPEMLQVVTQNRKNRRVIFGTAQNFYMLAKDIRTQCTEERQCKTFFGCLTIVRKRKPIMDTEGNVTEFKNKGMYFFIHSKKLRESYDTYEVVNSLSASGFQDRLPSTTVNNNIAIAK